MPKLPSLTPEKIIKILKRKGIVLDKVKGSHHIYYHPETTMRVVVPLHKRDIPKGTLLEILKQAGIPKEDWKSYYEPLPKQASKICSKIIVSPSASKKKLSLKAGPHHGQGHEFLSFYILRAMERMVIEAGIEMSPERMIEADVRT